MTACPKLSNIVSQYEACSSYIVQTKAKAVKSEDDSIPLPDPFPLPKHYPHQLESALATGKLSSKQKQAFVSEVASCMLRFKRYPSRDDYICVARSVISKYPFFKTNGGNPYVSLFQFHSCSLKGIYFTCRM